MRSTFRDQPKGAKFPHAQPKKNEMKELWPFRIERRQAEEQKHCLSAARSSSFGTER